MKKLSALLLISFLSGPMLCRADAPSEAPEMTVLKKREAAQRRAEELLQEVDRKLQEIRARVHKTAAGSKDEARDAAAALEKKKARVQKRLAALKASSQNAAKDVAEGLEGAVDDLEKAYKDAVRRFK